MKGLVAWLEEVLTRARVSEQQSPQVVCLGFRV